MADTWRTSCTPPRLPPFISSPAAAHTNTPPSSPFADKRRRKIDEPRQRNNATSSSFEGSRNCLTVPRTEQQQPPSRATLSPRVATTRQNTSRVEEDSGTATGADEKFFGDFYRFFSQALDSVGLFFLQGLRGKSI